MRRESGKMPHEKSVAPLETGMQECPVCHEHTAHYDPGAKANVCTRFGCNFYEQITRDHLPREWTEAEIRQIAREEAIKISKEFSGGHRVLGTTASPYDAGAHKPPRR